MIMLQLNVNIFVDILVFFDVLKNSTESLSLHFPELALYGFSFQLAGFHCVSLQPWFRLIVLHRIRIAQLARTNIVVHSAR